MERPQQRLYWLFWGMTQKLTNMAEEKIIIEVEFNADKAGKEAVELQKKLNEQKQELKELNENYKKGLISSEEYAKEQVRLRQTITETSREQRTLLKELELNNQVTEENALSYNQLTAELRLAERTLKKVEGTLIKNKDGTIELNKEYEEAQEKVKRLRQAQLDFDETIKRTQTNVGNYKESIEQALINIDPFGGKTQEAADILKGGFKNALQLAIGLFQTLGKVLIGNPIILLAGILAGAVGAFKRTNEGADQLAGIFAALNDIIRPFLTLLESIGAIVLPIIQTVLDFVIAIQQFFGLATSNTSEYAKELSRVDRELETIERRNQTLIAQEEQLKNIRDNEGRSLEARRQANEKLGKSIETRLNSELKKQQEKLALLKAEKAAIEETGKESSNLSVQQATAFQVEKQRLKNTKEFIDLEKKVGKEKADQKAEELAIIKAKGKTAELQNLSKDIEEQTALIAEKKADIYGQQNEQITNRIALLNESKDIEIELADLALEQLKLRGKITEGSKEELEVRKENAERRARAEAASIAEQNRAAIEQFGFKVDLEGKTTREIISFLNQVDFAREKQGLTRITSERKLLAISERLINDNLQAEKDFTDKQKEQLEKRTAQIEKAAADRAAKEAAILEESNRAELARLRLRVLQTEENTNQRLNAEIDLIEAEARIRKQNEKLTAEEIALINEETNQQILAAAESFSTAQSDLEKRKNTALLDLDKFRIDQQIKGIQTVLGANKSALDKELEDTGNNSQQKLEALEQFSLETISLLQAQAEAERQIELEKQRQILADDSLIEEEKALALEQSNARLLEIEDTTQTALTDIDRINSEARVKIAEEEAKQRTELAEGIAEAAGGLAGLLQEQTIAYKIFASAQAIISAYLAAVKALAAAPNPFIGGILYGTTLAQGLVAVAEINGAFAKGGKIEGSGSGGSKSDDIPVLVSRGETIINAESSRRFLPQLDAINRAGGGRPLTAQTGLAIPDNNTGAISSVNSPNLTDLSLIDTTVEAIKNVSIVTKISDINEVQETIDNTAQITDN